MPTNYEIIEKKRDAENHNTKISLEIGKLYVSIIVNILDPKH